MSEDKKRAFIAAVAAKDNDLARSILKEIDTAPSSPKREGALSSISKGFNTGLALLTGAPVDVTNWALSGVDKLAGTKLSTDRPVGGSMFLKKAMRGWDEVPALSSMTYDDINQLHPSDRPFAVAGETIGSAVLPAAIPLRMAKGATVAAPTIKEGFRSYVEPILKSARDNPGKFALTEAGLAAASGQGAAIAEMAAPGNPYARMGGEVLGGLVNPTRIVKGGYAGAKKGVESLAGFTSQAAKEEAAAKLIGKEYGKTGEDVNATIAALRAKDGFGLDLTSGQQTGSPTLLSIEKQLASESPRFAATAAQRPPVAFDRLREAGGNVTASGNSADLTAAMQKTLSDTQSDIAAQNLAAQVEALRATGRVGNVSNPDMAASSVRAQEILENAEQSAGNRQTAAWEQVSPDEPGDASNVLAARAQIRDRLLQEENMPAPIETFTGRLARQAETPINTGLLDESGASITRPGNASVTSGELLRLRTRALTAAKDARSGISPNSDLADQMDTIARGALADLNNIQSVAPAARVARNISRELHDDFTRTFAGESTSLKSTGAPSVEPENMLTKALGAGGTAGDVRMRQLSQAAERGDVGQYPRQEYQQAMNNEQERFLRGAVQSAFDPITGRVKPAKLAAWTRKNQAILDRFPQLRDDLASAQSAQMAATRADAIAQQAATNANKTRIADIARSENPSNDIAKILSASNPNRNQEFSELAAAAARSGQDAVDGLGSATMEYAFRAATGPTGKFDFERFSQILLDKGPSGKGASLLDDMQANNILDGAKASRLNAILERAGKIQTAIDNPIAASQMSQDADLLTDLITRILGAKFGSRLSSFFGTGGGLVAAEAGSKIARSLFNKLPSAKVTEILVEAAENPHLMEILLTKVKTEKEAIELYRQLNAFLVGSGVNFMRDQTEEDKEREKRTIPRIEIRRPLARTLDAVRQ